MTLTKEAKSQLNRIILVNRKIRPSSTPFGILSSFYSGMKTRDIISKFSNQVFSKNPRKDVCRNMHYLHSVGLLEKKSSRPVSYDITEKGRWYVVASRLGLPLFSLILLANVYVFQKNMQKNGRPDFYVVGFFFERIGRFITHAYRVHGTLIRKNYVRRCANQTIRIPDDMVKRLGEFDSDLRAMQEWYFDIGDQIDSFLIGNNIAENVAERPITA
ncbi:MAG: hypothetical protein WAO91_00820 [Candidatus Nitrosotenuis sp.]